MRTKLYFSLLAAVLSGTLVVSPIVRGHGKADTNKMVELLVLGACFVANLEPGPRSTSPRDFGPWTLESPKVSSRP